MIHCKMSISEPQYLVVSPHLLFNHVYFLHRLSLYLVVEEYYDDFPFSEGQLVSLNGYICIRI